MRQWLTSPDYPFIQTLSFIKSLLIIGYWNLTQPSAEHRRLWALLPRLKPRHTMLDAVRLRNLYRSVQHSLKAGGAGAIVECGTWRGGGVALMAASAQDMNTRCNVWVYDSFEGLPPPTDSDGDAERAVYYPGLNASSEEIVRRAFERVGYPLASVKLVRGWFNETLPVQAVDEPIAVLHIDGDWYESVMTCLEHLYDRVRSGGIIIIDDYPYWEGCKRAVDDFLRSRGMEPSVLESVGGVAVNFRKP